MASESQHLTLAELAEKSGVPGRTIRFYISRGLVPGPGKAGRGATYGQAHLQRLREIATLQAAGLTLAEIAGRLAGGLGKAAPMEPVAWWQYQAAEDVWVGVRADASPWRLRQVRAQVAQMIAGLRRKEGED